MRPGDEGGGAAGIGGRDGAPAAGEMDFGEYLSFTSLLDHCPPQLLLRDEGSGGGGSNGGGTTTTMTRDSEDVVSLNGMEFFVDSQSGHILGTDWRHMEGGEDGDSDYENYDDFLVRCEGDTDVEECFPTPIQEAVVEVVKSTTEIQKEVRVKDAKYKAEMTRAAKRRAIEGVVEGAGITFSDQDSDDCKDLVDSSDDDHAVDGNDLSRTKRKSRAKKLTKRTYYDESRLNEDYQFLLNMCFEDVHQFRRALLNYHVVHQRDWEYLRNDKNKITVCCKSGGTCPFVVMTSTLTGETTHVIRQLVLPHTCGKTNESSRINSVWLSKNYEDQIRSDPDMKISAFMDMVRKDYGVSISKDMAYRAKNKAIVSINGHHEQQYFRLRDYLQTVLNTNPGSRCIVNTIVNQDPQKNPRFHGLFYCLHAQVEGFLQGCRPFIGVDGCFLKLGNGFQILAATARDGNNNMFPLAFGVVGKEETSTWCWFLFQLRSALGGATSKHGPFTFMSDRQKGLLNAVKQIFPECEHRFCLRHIYANFQLAGFRGSDLKKIVDAAAYAFTHSNHMIAMNKLKKESIDAWKWLSRIPTKHWARHAMDTTCKTDLVVNNISEVFNSFILDQRDKPIVTMMDQILTKLMSRFQVRRDGVALAQWEITPHYVELLETEKMWARYPTVANAGNGIWRVETGAHNVHAVNPHNKTCGCFKWDLTGVPCKHAIAAIYMAREFPEDYVSDFFKKPMYKSTYMPMIYPVPGPHDWVKTDTVDIEPPLFATKPGRKKKKRRPSAGEGHDGSVKIATITCSNCKLKGHRYTTCTQTLKPHLAIRKAGHRSNRTRPDPIPAAPIPAPTCTPTEHATPQRHPTAPAPQHRHFTTPAPPRRNATAPARKLPSVCGMGTTRGWRQPRQNRPDSPKSPNSRMYAYFTPGRDAQRAEEEMQ